MQVRTRRLQQRCFAALQGLNHHPNPVLQSGFVRRLPQTLSMPCLATLPPPCPPNSRTQTCSYASAIVTSPIDPKPVSNKYTDNRKVYPDLTTIRSFATLSTNNKNLQLAKIRNLGVIAHIDAGKTTTSERILYYARRIRSIGNVDDGDTTMDFLEEERQRGITIQSACISCIWRGNQVNLVDTPGHVDFTVEVERSLRVLDGAIGVFDSVKGVQAQSETVWRQADRHNVPRIAFINKMDKDGASFSRAIRSIRTRLRSNAVAMQVPLILTPLPTAHITPDNKPPSSTESMLSYPAGVSLESNPGNKQVMNAVVNIADMSVQYWHSHDDDEQGESPVTIRFPGLPSTVDDVAEAPVVNSSDGRSPIAVKGDECEYIPLTMLASLHEAAVLRRKLLESLADVDEEVADVYLMNVDEVQDMTVESWLKEAKIDPSAGATLSVPCKTIESISPILGGDNAYGNSHKIHDVLLPRSLFHSYLTYLTKFAMLDVAPPNWLHERIRHATMASAFVPVFAGSSLKNRGVQPLLDAVLRYLPSPLDRPPLKLTAAQQVGKLKWKGGKGSPTHSTIEAPLPNVVADPNGPLCALAFKVTHDPQRGPVVFIRVYSGTIKAKDTLINVSATERKVLEQAAALAVAASGPNNATTTKGGNKDNQVGPVKERVMRLLEISANNTVDLQEVVAGNICAIVGLKETKTGDTLVLASQGQGAASSPTFNYLLEGIAPPEPVYFCSVEPPSTSAQADLDRALQLISLDDPSLRIAVDPETGQTIMKGMGELHLEIIKHRLIRDFKLDVYIGDMLVSYRESLQSPKHVSYTHSLSSVGPASNSSLSDTNITFELLLRPLFDVERGTTSGKVECEVLTVDDAYLQAAQAAKQRTSSSRDTEKKTGDKAVGKSSPSLSSSSNTSEIDLFVERVKDDLVAIEEAGLDVADVFTNAGSDVSSDLGPNHRRIPLTDPNVQLLLQEGITRQLSRGPVLGYPLTAVRVVILSATISGSGASQFSASSSSSTSSSSSSSSSTSSGTLINSQLSAGAGRALHAGLKQADAVLLEPVMKTEVTCHEEHVGLVLNDLVSRRRGTVSNVTNALDLASESSTSSISLSPGGPVLQVVQAEVPLAELRGYSSVLRSATQGSGNLSMEVADFRIVPQHVITLLRK